MVIVYIYYFYLNRICQLHQRAVISLLLQGEKKGKEKKSTPLTRPLKKEGMVNRINVIGTDNRSSQKGKKKMTTFFSSAR